MTAMTVARRRTPLVAATDPAARAAAFRRARRHSALVRVLRIGLPVVAVCLFATYGISVRMTIKDSSGGTLNIPIPTIVGEDLTMNNPEYEGYGKDGSRYLVGAATARQDIRQTGPVRLETIKARLTQPDANLTVVNARRGEYDTKSGVLEAYDGIDIVSQNGMKAKLSRATIQSKEGIVTSDEPVQVTLPTGQLDGRRMILRQKTKEAAFFDGVTARLVPEQKQAATPAPTATPKGLAPTGTPIDIVSERLDIDDARKVALFRGKVRAVQGEQTLVAPELEVQYEGSAAPGAAGAPKQADQPAEGQGRLKKLIARPEVTLTRGADVVTAREMVFDQIANTATLTGGVVVTSPPDRRATGDRADVDTTTNRIRLSGNVEVTAGADRRATADVADIDQKTDVAVLTGRQVVVTQGTNVLRGKKLTIDRKGATSEMLAPGERVTARMVRPEAKAGEKAQRPKEAAPGGMAFATDPNAPIDLESDSLFVNDQAKTATFRGDVKVVQGDFTVRTPELVATYTGQATLPDASGQTPQKGEGGGAELKTLRANRKVVVTSKDNQSVTGDWALFDMKANTVTVGGDVVLTQGRSVIKGSRLVIDMTTGQYTIDPGAGGATVAAPSADGTMAVKGPGGRVGAVFYPKELKEMREKRAAQQAAEGAEKKAAPAAPSTPQPAAKSGPATSGWSAATEPPRTN